MGESVRRYRVRISTTRPFEVVAHWSKRPDVDAVLETFKDGPLTTNVNKNFNIEVSEVNCKFHSAPDEVSILKNLGGRSFLFARKNRQHPLGIFEAK